MYINAAFIFLNLRYQMGNVSVAIITPAASLITINEMKGIHYILNLQRNANESGLLNERRRGLSPCWWRLNGGTAL